MVVLDLKNINKSFGGNQVIQNLNLQLDKGKIYALLGDNGTGKTTLLNIINGQVFADSGDVIFKQKNINYRPTYKRANTGIVRLWQHGKVFENMTVFENLLTVRKQLGENLLNYIFQFKNLKKQQSTNKRDAEKVLQKLELSDKAKNLGKELSFGQQRLLDFGRVMMHPDIEQGELLILIDEPFAGIHENLIKKITLILQNFANKGNTILMIEHNIKEVVRFADKVLLMQNGRIAQQIISDKFDELKISAANG